jgi:hypothetical protein
MYGVLDPQPALAARAVVYDGDEVATTKFTKSLPAAAHATTGSSGPVAVYVARAARG